MAELVLNKNTSKVETIIAINMRRQRKPHRKSHEGCEQCKDRHIKVRGWCRLHPVISGRDGHGIDWLSRIL